MKKIIVLVSTLSVAISAIAQVALDKPQIQGKGEVSESLAAVRLANDLLRYGYENESTISLINALQIFAENPTQKLDAEREGTNVDVSVSTGKGQKVSFDYETVLSDARKFAEGDTNLLSLIDEIDAEAKGNTRGAVNGPSRTYEIVDGNSTDTYHISFIAGYIAEILVSGDGDTDLDLYVYDSNGNLIASDSDYTDNCYVRWVPAWTGRYIVKVVNRGPVYNRYVLLTN